MKTDRDASLVAQVVSPLAGLAGLALGIGFLEMPGQGHDRTAAAALLQFFQGMLPFALAALGYQLSHRAFRYTRYREDNLYGIWISVGRFVWWILETLVFGSIFLMAYLVVDLGQYEAPFPLGALLFFGTLIAPGILLLVSVLLRRSHRTLFWIGSVSAVVSLAVLGLPIVSAK